MTHARSRAVTALALVIAAGCKQEVPHHHATGLPGEPLPRPARRELATLRVPPLFASIPADTPYLLAAIEAAPAPLPGGAAAALRAVAGAGRGALAAGGADPRLLDALGAELDGALDDAGLAHLGLPAWPRFAIYSLAGRAGRGALPVVARIEAQDPARLRAAIERIVARAGAPSSPVTTPQGHRYWKIAGPGALASVIALSGGELVVAFGAAGELDAALGLILGSDPPARSMSDGKRIKELAARYGFGPQLIGFVDTWRIANAALAAAGATPGPACAAAVDRIAFALPRLAIGVGELSATQASWGLAVELGTHVLADLKALASDSAGLSDAVVDRALVAVGAGVDLGRSATLVRGAARQLKSLGDGCKLDALSGEAAQVLQALAEPLFDAASLVSGAIVSLRAIGFAPGTARGPVLDRLDAVAMLASPDPRALFARVLAQEPAVRRFHFSTDGKLHDLDGGDRPLAFPVAAGVSDTAIVVATGDQRAARGAPLLAPRAAKVPLVFASYDLGQLVELARAAGAEPAAAASSNGRGDERRARLGRGATTLELTDRGVVAWSAVELR